MNPAEVESYNNVSIDELLQSELNNHDPRTWVLVLAKARLQQCTQNSLTMTLMLLQRDGDKWLEVLKRFSFLDFKLVFSFCISKMKTYTALMESVYKLGQAEHQRMMQQTIENALQYPPTNPHLSTNQLWPLYLSYLSQCTNSFPHRTLFALQNIERRLGNSNNIYSQLVDLEKAHFIEVLCRMLKHHQDEYLRKMQLRKFWQSIGNTIKFLRMTMNTEGLMTRLLVRLKSFSPSEGWESDRCGSMQRHKSKRAQQCHYQVEKQRIVQMLTHASCVSLLQDIFIYHSQRLAIQLLQVPLITHPSSYSPQQLTQLQTSLIYHIQSDDLPSLLSQLLVSLGQNIPNFINTFVCECMFLLTKEDDTVVGEMTTEDVILKLCVLSKLVIEQSECNGWDFSIKELVDRLIMLGDRRSQTIQVKTLLLMHYFKQILPQSYFLQYHDALFRILKHIITEQISNQNSQCHHLHPIPNYKPFEYTQISYTECMKILQQQTQRREHDYCSSMQMNIRKRKFTNHNYVHDLFRNHVLEIADKLISLVTIQGYCQTQSKLLTILRNLLEKYPIVPERNTLYLIKVLSKQFMQQYERLEGILSMRNKNYSKILLLLQCIELVWGDVSEQSYFQCEQHMLPVLTLLKQQHAVDFQDDLLRLLSIMIFKAKMITPQLNNFVIYMKRVLIQSPMGLLSMESVLKEMCKPCIVRSVREEWLGLVVYVTGMFSEYVRYVLENRVFELYHKDWVCAVHVIMLFVQSYHQEYGHQQQLSQSLRNLQSIMMHYGVQSEQTHQLLMTIHHAICTTKHHHQQQHPSYTPTMAIDPHNNNTSIQDIFSNITTLQQLSQLTLYQQKYSLHLLQLTCLDVLNINLRNGNFDFSDPHNHLYQFIDMYKYLQMHVHDQMHCKSSSPNDLLPFSKINLNQYAAVILDSLRKQKLIDIQQFTQLKSIFLPHHYLVSNTLFQSSS